MSSQVAAQGLLRPKQPRYLPFGHTLHYEGCGCPVGWTLGSRQCDAVDSCVQQAFLAVSQGLLQPARKLRVLFCLPHHNLTGGMKMLVEQIRLLRSQGHWVGAVLRSGSAARAMPPWADAEADLDVVCPLGKQMGEVCHVDSLDVVVVGIFHQVAEWLLASPAPVLYWEQGHEWLFGDPVRLQAAHNYRQQDQLFHRAMHLPCALAAVSEAVQSILSQEFRRTALLVHNGIDAQRFRPGPRFPAPPTAVYTANNFAEPPGGAAPRPSVLLVGNPALPLKGFDTAIAALALVNQSLPIEVAWICQSQPTPQQLPALASSGLRIALHVSPAQELLAELYRGHDAFLFASKYEAWGLPVLEAMASGLAVVTTSCLGVSSFARPGVNCFMAPPQDALGLARGLLNVLQQPEVRERLAAAGRQTAVLFSPDTVAAQLEAVLYSLTVCAPDLLRLRQACWADIQFASIWAAHACARSPEQQQALVEQQRVLLAALVARQQQEQQQSGHNEGAQQQLLPVAQQQALLSALVAQQLLQQQQRLSSRAAASNEAGAAAAAEPSTPTRASSAPSGAINGVAHPSTPSRQWPWECGEGKGEGAPAPMPVQSPAQADGRLLAALGEVPAGHAAAVPAGLAGAFAKQPAGRPAS